MTTKAICPTSAVFMERASRQTCDSRDYCDDFIKAATRVVQDAAKVHTVARPERGQCYMPDTCGPTMWFILHHMAEAFRDTVCGECGGAAVAMMKFMHDGVNRKLGKPYYDEPNFHGVLSRFNALAEGRKPEPLVHHAEQKPSIDLYGSRCRDPKGHLTYSEKCPGVSLLPSAHGPETFAMGPTGVTRYDLRHKVVEADDLIVSNDPLTFLPNPRFPSDLQPRMRTRAANKAQVIDMAAHIAPDALLVDFHAIDRGAPIVGADNVVESGNGRTMALIRAAKEHPDVYARYRSALMVALSEYGLDETKASAMQTPILVRERLTDVDRRAFVEEANGRATLSASAVEQARSDADHVTLDMLRDLAVGENEPLADAVKSSANLPFVRRFVATLPKQDQAQFMDSKGNLSADGLRRVVMAVFVRAFPGDAGLMLAERAFESIDEDVRTAINALGRSVGIMARAEAMTRSGERSGDLSISDDVAAAVNAFAKIKATPGLTVQKYLSQGQLFGQRELTPFQEGVLGFLDDNRRSAKRIAAVLSAYAQAVIASPAPSQGALFGPGGATKQELWEAAVKSAGTAPPKGLFGETMPNEIGAAI